MHQRTKIAVAVTLAVSAMSAFAQSTTDATQLQRVEVTGSRIRAVDLATAQPVQVMSQEQIQKSGLVTVGDILNTLSAAGNPDISKSQALASGLDVGGQYLNMRNLGSERLLVLVDGKRWSQSINGLTDMSTVPSSMVDRIEILKDGASAVYGSDAIAGVVNIILKKTLEGGEASVYYGKNEKGDGTTKDFSLSFGTNSDKASIMFGLTHSEQGEVWAHDRELTSYTYGPNHPTDNLGGGPWGRIRQVGTAGNAVGFDRYLNHTGSYDGVGVGSDSRNQLNYHSPVTKNDQYNSTQDMHFLTPTQLSSIFTKGTVNLPMNMRFSTTAMYAQRTSENVVAGYPLNSLSQVANPVYIDKNSYYNPYGNQGAGIAAGAGQDLFFYRRTIEVPRNTQNKNKTLHIDVALQGDFNLGSNAWNWGLGYNHSSVSGEIRSTGNVNLFALKRALGPSYMGADGVVRCGTSVATTIAGCVPFNILGGPSASTPEALAYVMHDGTGTYGSTVNSATADLAGEIFQLPAGGVGVAVGAEHRQIRGYDRPDPLVTQALTTNLAGFPTTGDYSVKEVYGELNVPILKGVPFAQLLSLNLASRYSDYSNFGDTTNSKASLMWKPISDLLVRGTWAEGFRAPSLGDTFGGGSQSFDTFLDPCDSQYGAARTNATIAQRCAAAGVPAGYRQKNQAGLAVTSGGAQTPTAFNTGVGNQSLTPETATTKTAGIVYNPSYVSGLSVAVDYFDIEIKNRISSITTPYTLSQCYVEGVQAFCDNVVRDASGAISRLDRGNTNMGSMSTKGVDLELNYRLPRTSFGQFNLRSQSTYLDEYVLQSTNISEKINYAGAYPYYRVRSNLTLDWTLGNWSATWGTRYLSPAKSSCWESDPEAPEECSDPGVYAKGYPTGYDRKGSQFFHDLSVGFKTPWKGKIMVGINNIFDREPKVQYDAAASAALVDGDVPLDRFFWVRYNQSF
jgi:iron complex outermembrane receptor protein